MPSFPAVETSTVATWNEEQPKKKKTNVLSTAQTSVTCMFHNK